MKRPGKGSKDLRKGRLSVPYTCYVVTACCHQRKRLFTNASCAAIVEQGFISSDEAGWTGTFAYVVMPDHFHWLIRLGDMLDLSKIVMRLKGSTSNSLGKVTKLNQRIWQSGFHDHALRESESVEAHAEYILMNPVRAGLVSDPLDYPFKHSVWLNRG